MTIKVAASRVYGIVRAVAALSAALVASSVALAGSISGSFTTSTTTVNLTTFSGGYDWWTFGNGNTVSGRSQRSGAYADIQDFTPVGTPTIAAYNTASRRLSWSDGTSPYATGSSLRVGLSASGVGNGFQLVLPADAQTRTVRLYVHGYNSSGRLTASLSDGSSSDYVHSTGLFSGTNYTRNFTITYSANGPGRQLVLRWVVEAGAGFVGLNAVATNTFTYVNHAPTVTGSSSVNTQQGVSSSVSVSGYDSDGDSITYSATGLPPGMTINSTSGAITGTATAAGAYSPVVTVTDSSSATGTLSFTWNVAPAVNNPPTSASAVISATLNTPVTVSPSWSDPDPGDTHVVSIVSPPAPSVGSAAIAANNRDIIFTPAPDYVGPVSFTFRVTDAALAYVDGTASGQVTAPDPAVVTSVTSTQGTLIGSVALSWPASANAQTYTVYRGSSPSDPSPVSIATVGATSYTDLSAAPGVQYFYSVVAANAGKTAAPSSPVLGYADTPPSAASATFSATLETPVSVTPSFTDPDPGETFTLSIVTPPSNGTAVAAGSSITYTPASGFVGTDSFTFRVTDRAGASVVGTASGTVTALDPAPVASVTATKGTVVGSVSLSWLPSANALSYEIRRGSSPSDPSPSVIATVTATTYSDASGGVGFPYYYSVRALTVGKAAAPSPAELGYSDTPPSSASAGFSTPFNTQATFAPLFTDPDPSEVFTLSIVTQPSNGTASISGGSLVYQPNLNYVGPDSFTFQVTDKAGASVSGTASGIVVATVPDPVAGLSATKGTLLSSVNVSWTASANASTYSVFRGTSASDPSPSLLATIGGLAYTDTTALPGVPYYYFVRGINAINQGPMSSGILGFADTPPSNLAASFTALQNQSVSFVPTWDDPDPGEVFTVALIGQPSVGSASVSNNQVIYVPPTDYLGPVTLQISVTDKAGATVSTTASGVVNPGVPDAPLDFVVTQGTLLGSVKLDWQNMPGSLQYLVLRAESSTDPNPAVIATVYTNSFSDTNVTPGLTYYYRIRGVGASGTGPASQQVSGYSDTPPSSTTASATTLFNIPVTFTPSVVDPDPNESITFAVLSAPSNGAVTVSSDGKQLTYTPASGFSGVDTFSYRATDVAGAFVSGTASVAVGCPTPTVSALVVSQPKLFAGSGFTVSATYGNTGCPVDLEASFEVKAGTTVVHTDSVPTLPGSVSSPVSFAVSSLQAGAYVVSLSVRDKVTGNRSTSTLPLSIASYRMPSFTATASAFTNLDNVTVAVGSSPDCALTSNRSSAIADHSLCFYEVTPIPPGLSFQTAQVNPTWSGQATQAGVYQPTLTVYQFDDFGVAKTLGTATRSMDIRQLTSMTFSSPATVPVAQYMQEASVIVTQTAGLPCQITTSLSNARSGTLAGTRMCYLEISGYPAHGRLLPNGAASSFLAGGTETVSWVINGIDAAGNVVPFSNGSTDVIVSPPDVSFDVSTGSTTPIATVTQASVRLNSVGSVSCVLTTDVAKAQVAGLDKPCLVEWRTIPSGVAQDTTTDAPVLKGVFLSVGSQPVEFDVSYFDVTGAKRLLISSTKSVLAEAPPPPPIILRAARTIGPDVLSVSVAGGPLATIVADTTKWPVDAKIKWSDEAFEQTYRVSALRGTQLVSATAAPLWTRRQVRIRLELRNAPEIFSEKTYDVVSVPPDPIKLSLDALDTTVPDSVPTPVSARVDMQTTTGPLYDAGTMGSWLVQFGFRDSTGSFIPNGPPVQTDSEGVARATVDPYAQTVLRVMAKATAVTSVAEYSRTLETGVKMATVVKGTPIEGTVVIKGQSEGPAPLVGIFRVSFASRADQLANESVAWHVSSDGGSTYQQQDATGVQAIFRLGEGRYKVKASFVNRNTKVLSESLPVDVSVWSIPKVNIAGTTYAFPGTPAALAVNLLHPSGAPVVSPVVEWKVERRVILAPGAEPPPPVATGNTTTVAFTGDVPGIYMLSVRARMAASNPDDPRAWGSARAQIIYGAPEKPVDFVTGPARAEVGKPYTFETLVRTRYPIEKSNLKLIGRWILPDGTIVPGMSAATYTPTDSDLAARTFITVTHESWVEGYEDTTKAVGTKTVPIWKYVWPAWQMFSSLVTQVAPTNARFTVRADNLAVLGSLEGLTYTWSVPPAIRVLKQPTSIMDTSIDFGGSHPVSVTISDSRGNTTTLDTTVSVSDPAPYQIDIPVSNQSKWTHAPITVGVAPKVSGGHPLDSIVNWSYWLDGVNLNLPSKNVASIALSSPGTYTVEVRIQSKLGATASKQTTITVPANTPATCQIVATPSSNRSFVALAAQCNDPDGYITKYQWSINGVVQSFATSGKWTYIVQPGVIYPISVGLTVTDTGGAQSVSSLTVN